MDNNTQTCCGGSVILKDDRMYSVVLPTFVEWALRNKVSVATANLVRDFIVEKINNGTLYTPDDMASYSPSKRFQLFANGNIAEHITADVLGGQILKSNDVMTIDSIAVVGRGGFAAADIKVDGIDVEVKVVGTDKDKHGNYSTESVAKVLKAAHNKPVVVVYVISPYYTTHWYLYVKNANGEYTRVMPNSSNELETLAFYWQEKLKIERPILPLVNFIDETDDSLTVSLKKQY